MVEGVQARNLLLHGTQEAPQVVVPDRRISPEHIIKVTDVTLLPPNPEFTGGRRRPYAIFAGYNPFPLIMPRIEPTVTKIVKRETPLITISETGILLLTGVDQDAFTMLLQRPQQRVAQFGRMTAKADDLELEMDKVISSEEKEALRMKVDRLRKIALNLYANELRHDPYSKECALSLIALRLPTNENAEKGIRRVLFHMKDIETEVNYCLKHPVKRMPDGASHLTGQNLKTNDKQNAGSVADKADKRESDQQEQVQYIQKLMQTSRPDYTVRYSAILDRPNPMVALYFRKLFERPF